MQFKTSISWHTASSTASRAARAIACGCSPSRCAPRVAREHRRRDARLQLDPDAVAVTAHLDRTLEQRQRVALHDRMLDCLSEEQREVFVMAEIEQWSAPEIAATLSVKLNTVYSRLRLARAQFERALARHRAALEAK